MEDIIKLEKKIFKGTGNAIADFSMIEDGDKIMVGVSGGKDSWVLLSVLMELQRRAPVSFDLVAVNLDQGYDGYETNIIEDYLISLRVPYRMISKNINQIVADKNQKDATWCSLCSRLRRGSLYGFAEELKCNKIALGHHQDDMIETLLLNQFFVGRLAAMSPKLRSDDGKNIVIRPLIYVLEDDIREYSRVKQFPIVCCKCPLMCGEASHNDFKRRKMKLLIKNLQEDIPHIKNSLLASLKNIKKTHLLDQDLWEMS